MQLILFWVFFYFRFVGQSLGVNKNNILNDLVIDIFFVNVVIMESILRVLFFFVGERNYKFINIIY